MIKKDVKKSIKIQRLEALRRRLPQNHPKRPYVEAELGRASAGERGEESVNFFLSFLPKDILILHGIRLQDCEGRYFQIDKLLLTPSCIIILEVKNMAGTLYFQDIPEQLIQKVMNELEKAYPCPILQVERQRSQLQTVLEKLQVPELPIYYYVVISHPNTVIKISPTFLQARKVVIQSSAIPTRINPLLNSNKSDKITLKELKKIFRKLTKRNHVYDPDFLEKFEISPKQLLTGVQCPHCFQLPMQRKHGTWYCASCKQTSKDAHISALDDYFLLINETITNQQLRNFLHLSSISVANKTLSNSNLVQNGDTKGCFYTLS